MSRRQAMFDIQPMIDKAQKDITQLCYLGLHQYAKENKLIGRSRPMLSDEMTDYYIKRLFFRLTVACVQQLVSVGHMEHGKEIQQINYLNVGGYRILRLYGLLDKEMFIVQQRTGHFRSMPIWENSIPTQDKELLSQRHTTYQDIERSLDLSTRALIEVGGVTFCDHLRKSMRFTLNEIKRHIQYEPKERTKVRNIAVDLVLFDLAYTANRTVDVPCHIEKIVEFRDTIWPWIEVINTTDARESMLYLTQNWPSTEAVQVKMRALQRERILAEEQARELGVVTPEEQEHGNQLESLRDRFRVHFGDQRETIAIPVDQDDNQATNLGEHIHIALDEALGNDHVPGVHGGELTVPYGQIPPPEPVELAAPWDDDDICNVCQGDYHQCGCCHDCENTEGQCTCYTCGACGEDHDDCFCCEICDVHPCECEDPPELDDQKQIDIHTLRLKVNEALGD